MQARARKHRGAGANAECQRGNRDQIRTRMTRVTEAHRISIDELQDLWGINLYPDLPADAWLEFNSTINLRPSFGNRSRGVDEPATRAAIVNLVSRLVRR